jgi:hypothetical protein
VLFAKLQCAKLQCYKLQCDKLQVCLFTNPRSRFKKKNIQAARARMVQWMSAIYLHQFINNLDHCAAPATTVTVAVLYRI